MKNNINDSFTVKIKVQIQGWGADLSGVADLEPLRRLKVHPPDLLDPFEKAVSIGVAIPLAVFDSILDKPTSLYAAAYRTANLVLNDVAAKTAAHLERDGYPSLFIPASAITDRPGWRGAITHKAVARMAGLGWQGKNLLLVNQEHGSRIRLVTVLTAAPLVADEPVKNRCGRCTFCIDACPVGAIKGKGTDDHYRSRSDALDLDMCADLLSDQFAKIPEVGAEICGICIKACPFGRKKNRG